MRYYFLAILFLALWAYPSVMFSKTTVVTSEYVYHVPENVTADQARETAVVRARAQAIADEFGTTVNQVTSLVVENNNGRSSSDFLSMGGSELKGEWIEDIEAPVFEYMTDGANIAIKVKIKGRIREIKGAKVQVETKILRNGVLDTHETDQFFSGDELYVSLKSPVDGYIAIYLLDTSDNAFCLLPYQAQADGIYATKANRRYLFFHPDHAYGVKSDDVDQIIVDTESDHERNRIFILFSPNKFFKGVDVKMSDNLPRQMNIDDFRKWISSVVKKDPELTITERIITIASDKQ